MNSNSKFVFSVILVMLLVTNVATGYMFYSRKSSVINREQIQILNLKHTITALKNERNSIAKKVDVLKHKIDSLTNEKSKVVSVYIDRVNSFKQLLPEQQDSIFLKHLSAISKADSNIRSE